MEKKEKIQTYWLLEEIFGWVEKSDQGKVSFF